MSNAGPVSVILVNYGDPALLVRCLASIGTSADAALIREVLVVDNGYPTISDSEAAVRAVAHPFATEVLRNPHTSYSSGVNAGARRATGRLLLIANSDVELLPGHSIRDLISQLDDHGEVGVVGPQLVYPNGAWQRSHGRVPTVWQALASATLLDSLGRAVEAARFGWSSSLARPHEVGYVDGAFLLTKRACFETVGGFDEQFSFYGEDCDFCWRARRAGWGVRFVPSVRVLHVRGGSSTHMAPERYAERLIAANVEFVRRHAGPRHARWYRRLFAIGAAERAVLYTLVGALTRSDRLRRLAAEARRDVGIVTRGRG